jgi:heme-degrading monooxygenase HmoA
MPPERPGCVAIWQFRVRPECAAEFERVYGPHGAWAELFRDAPGWLGTQLLRDRSDPGRYLTIDSWTSAEAWEILRSARAAEYEALDARCERLTLEELEVGRMDLIG